MWGSIIFLTKDRKCLNFTSGHVRNLWRITRRRVIGFANLPSFRHFAAFLPFTHWNFKIVAFQFLNCLVYRLRILRAHTHGKALWNSAVPSGVHENDGIMEMRNLD